MPASLTNKALYRPAEMRVFSSSPLRELIDLDSHVPPGRDFGDRVHPLRPVVQPLGGELERFTTKHTKSTIKQEPAMPFYFCLLCGLRVLRGESTYGRSETSIPLM